MPKGCIRSDELSSDAAKPDNAERAPRQSDTRMIRAFAPPAFARQSRFDGKPQAQRQNEGDRDGGDGGPHGQRRVGEKDSMGRERQRIDGVVAHAIAGDDAQLSALAGELGVGDARAADHQRLVIGESRRIEAPLLRRDDSPGEPCLREQ